MAEEKKTYPMLPIAHWWALRKKFKQSIPGVVTDGYLATVLSMGANSARANVLPYLKTLGIIDAEGKTTDRAKQWRDDARYPAVCKEILKEVYPQELLDAVTDSSQREQAETWFAHKTAAGESAVGRMAVLYCVLLEADASKQPDEKAERARPEKKFGKTPAIVVAEPVEPEIIKHTAANKTPNAPQIPGININLEIHISADSTPDQIDAIFASMAKHIYQRG
jgi:Family of unknown function (DUF5343)